MSVPAHWRRHAVLATNDAWAVGSLVGDERAALHVVEREDGLRVTALGDPDRCAALIHTHLLGAVVHGVSFARAGDGPDEAAALDVAQALGLVPVERWDWMLATSPLPADRGARRLDLPREAGEIRRCLATANPRSEADPDGPAEAGWWGVDGPDGLRGVVGAQRRPGDADVPGSVSWHVHGLGVLPQHRRAGLGAALTGAVTAAGFAAGCSWVSLGLYAGNDDARRIYRRLGYRTLARFTQLARVRPVRVELTRP